VLSSFGWREGEIMMSSANRHASVLSKAARNGFLRSVEHKLNQQPDLICQGSFPLLDTVLISPSSHEATIYDRKMVQPLLERGANPNGAYAGSTVWTRFLEYLIPEHGDEPFRMVVPSFPDAAYRIVKEMLNHGADIDAPSVETATQILREDLTREHSEDLACILYEKRKKPVRTESVTHMDDKEDGQTSKTRMNWLSRALFRSKKSIET
jgi:hypothetical protein